MLSRHAPFTITCIAFLSILLFSCNYTPDIKGFNKKQWKQDRNACKDKRSQQIDALINGKEKIIGLQQATVRNLLGRPEKITLYRRGRRYFYYFLEPGPSCSETQKSGEEYYKVLSIQLNAMDMVKEVTIKRKSF